MFDLSGKHGADGESYNETSKNGKGINGEAGKNGENAGHFFL